MSRSHLLLIGTLSLFSLLSCNQPKENATYQIDPKVEEKQHSVKAKEWAIAIHGGAGTILKKNMSESKEREIREKLEEVLSKGRSILANGGSSLDAVEACIQIMEESPLFNAGKGAVFTNAGTNEMDASIMNGADLNAGAVAGVSTIKSPISAARKVMEQSPHVMLSGKGAEEFAKEEGEEMVNPSYFFDQKRFDQLQRIKANEIKAQANSSQKQDLELADHKFGTVGVVCLDRNGDLAAGTSTGGMTNKRWGRIGDSPIIGAGTYADNRSCAVSATGHGEFFIRAAVAHEISALVRLKGMDIQAACEQVILDDLVKMKASGGVIAMDKYGNQSLIFNTPGMYRAFINSDGEEQVAFYK